MAKKRGTSILFVNCSRQVLLFLRDRRNDIPFPDCWDILGGHVEEGETPEECIQREMREEIDIDIGRPMLFHEYHMTDRIEFTFWQEAEFELSEIALHEGQRLKWFTENEILEMSDDDLAFGFRKVLLDFYRERPFDKATQKDRESESRDQLESRI